MVCVLFYCSTLIVKYVGLSNQFFFQNCRWEEKRHWRYQNQSSCLNWICKFAREQRLGKGRICFKTNEREDWTNFFWPSKQTSPISPLPVEPVGSSSRLPIGVSGDSGWRPTTVCPQQVSSRGKLSMPLVLWPSSNEETFSSWGQTERLQPPRWHWLCLKSPTPSLLPLLEVICSQLHSDSLAKWKQTFRRHSWCP